MRRWRSRHWGDPPDLSLKLKLFCQASPFSSSFPGRILLCKQHAQPKDINFPPRCSAQWALILFFHHEREDWINLQSDYIQRTKQEAALGSATATSVPRDAFIRLTTSKSNFPTASAVSRYLMIWQERVERSQRCNAMLRRGNPPKHF